MKLSIIIPCHNEERSIEKILEKVSAIDILGYKEVIVVNDGSDDATKDILARLKEKFNFKLFTHEKNMGKGEAIQTGLGAVTGDLVIIQDADLEYDPADIPLLLRAMHEDISAVYGDRGTKRWPKRGFHYVLGAKILSGVVNILYDQKLADVYTGYKLFNLYKIPLSMLKSLKSSGFEFEAEVTCKILENKGKIIEVPINYIPRNKEEGKHIGFMDAVKGFYTILECFISKK